MLTAALSPRRLRLALAVLASAASASTLVPACVAPPDGVDLQRGAAVDICATAPEGALCDDKNVCTVFDVCKGGVCKGSAAPDGTLCTDGNVCTANDSCRGGTCKGDPVPDTTACTDGDPCTVGDACKAGVCLSGAGTLACNDGIACTVDVCVPEVGCVFSPVGDCNVPKDGGGDASDAKSDATDATSDATDGKTDGPADVMSMTDAKDAMSMEAPPAMDAPIESLVDALPMDAPVVDAPVADAPTDVDAPDAPAGPDAEADVADGGAEDASDAPDAAPEDAAADAADAEATEDAPVVTLAPPLLHATGGACTCEAAPSSGGSVAAWLALGLALALRRRRR